MVSGVPFETPASFVLARETVALPIFSRSATCLVDLVGAFPPSRRPRPSRERQTGVTSRFPVRRAEPTFLADEMSAPADFQVNDAVSEERTSGRSDALSVRKISSGSTVSINGRYWDAATRVLPGLRSASPICWTRSRIQRHA